MRGLLTLTWLEIKIFLREPLGVFGTIGMPVIVFAVIGRAAAGGRGKAAAQIAADVPAFGAILIALSAVLSLVAIIAIYRDGGILKRLRATPLSPITILLAHVIVKLLLTAVTLAVMIAAGRRYAALPPNVPLASFTVALLFVTLSILAIGFVIASVVPTARFAQPAGTLVLYPMLACSGLFVPIEALPPALQRIAPLLPLTYAVSLLKGIWRGDAWRAHTTEVAALAIFFAACTAISARVFKWE
jgi:ABC-2 type transport system permease protein